MNKKKSHVHFYINKTAHKEYAQRKIQFSAKLNLCSAVNTNINLITSSYNILKIWAHGCDPNWSLVVSLNHNSYPR